MINITGLILKGILAGILIGMSCVAYISVDIQFLGALLFSLGLCAICHNKLKLFTGIIGNSNNIPELIKVWLSNFVGICIVVQLALLSGKNLDGAEYIANIKFNIPLYSTLILAIFCGILMQLAVSAYKDNPFITILCVIVFLMSGFEHCIANMFYLIFSSNKFAILYVLLQTLGNTIGAKLVASIQDVVSEK